jgi:hypothetical protein
VRIVDPVMTSYRHPFGDSKSSGQRGVRSFLRNGQRTAYNSDMQPPAELEFSRYLEPLNALPFVQALDIELTPRAADRGVDAEVKVTTPRRTFKLAAVFKRSYLDQVSVNGLIAQQALVRDPLLLVARYIPAPTGERLAPAGINFVDAVGNLHLNLGGQYYAFVVGRKEKKHPLAERRTTAAMVQVSFTLLVYENAVNWPVRKLAEAAGVGKTAAADARRQLVEMEMLVESRSGWQMSNRGRVQEHFLAAYEHVLRPDLWIGTFRPRQRNPDVLLRKFKDWADRNQVTWAVAGGTAAFALNHCCRGERITIFSASLPEHLDRELELFPDQTGPCTVLRSFGTLFPWRIQGKMPIAHPLLIYAELLHDGEPRALEAAAEIREKYLAK